MHRTKRTVLIATSIVALLVTAAAGATDRGHEGGSFALDANGRLNRQLIRDNAH